MKKNRRIWNTSKKAWKYFVISLDLKPIYDKDTNSLNWDKLWSSIYEQLPESYLESIFWDKRSFFEKIFWLKKEKTYKEKQEEINYLKSKYDLWSFIKSFVEDYSKQEDILLLIDEYDKPVNDCLKYKKIIILKFLLLFFFTFFQKKLI